MDKGQSWLLAMSPASGAGPGWLLFSFGMGLVSGSKCPRSCQCQAQEVTCTGMQLTEYPRDMPLDTRRLYLDDNKLTDLPAMPLGLLSDLVYLDCRRNRIREVMDYTFIGVFRLVYLDLSSNNLTSISPFSFSVLSSLVQLSIADNPHLLSLHKHTFANTSSLRYLDLRNTGLQTLDHQAFHHLAVLQTLYLSGNPWRCNCSFLDFAIYLIMSHLSHPGERTVACRRRRDALPKEAGVGAQPAGWLGALLGRAPGMWGGGPGGSPAVEQSAGPSSPSRVGWPWRSLPPLSLSFLTHKVGVSVSPDAHAESRHGVSGNDSAPDWKHCRTLCPGQQCWPGLSGTESFQDLTANTIVHGPQRAQRVQDAWQESPAWGGSRGRRGQKSLPARAAPSST